MPPRYQINIARAELNGRGASPGVFTMQKHVLALTTSAFILACGAIAASAQQVPDVPTLQQQLKRQLQGAQTPRRSVEDDSDQDDNRFGGRMMGWRYGPGWGHHEGWRRGPMGSASMGHGMMMRMLFALMDSDGDGTISLQEFQAAHERIFRAMDANKDGRLTLEEIQAFMQETRRSVPRQ
jgi:hypothetical protein